MVRVMNKSQAGRCSREALGWLHKIKWLRRPSWKKCPLSLDLGDKKTHATLGVGTDLK